MGARFLAFFTSLFGTQSSHLGNVVVEGIHWSWIFLNLVRFCSIDGLDIFSYFFGGLQLFLSLDYDASSRKNILNNQ